ncbi:hypothetical protein ACG873_06615 [Mesorhizobium sp. AaZ16]|uniref:hypothetical protein n=1 Tax=Mesorhizobium sp. AaZ16 TaxID=3402289 RepID=UPI00374EBAE1
MTVENKAPAEARLPKPESLEAKFKLLSMLPYDSRVRRKHALVFGFILDWFHSKYGDALASVRHVVSTIKERDPAGKGLYAGDVHSALSDLVAWDFLHQEKGSGRRASRYVPNWSLVCSVRETTNTTESTEVEISVRETPNADVRETPNATGDSVRDFMNEDPSTRTRPQDRVNGIDGIECAAPTAPLSAGLSPADAGTAQEATKAKDPFEQLWRAYDHKQKKKESRAAYTKLAPDADLHATMMESAIAWQASWSAQNKRDAPRYTLAKWIEREDYECSPPTAYKPKERKAKDRPAANDNRSRGKLSDQLRILEVEAIGNPFGDYRYRIKLDGPAGEQEHVLRVLNENGVAEDNEAFNKIQRAFGSDTAEWPGQRCRVEMDDGRIVDVVPQKAPARVVEIAEADAVVVDDAKIIVAKLTDADGKPEGTIDIVYESDDEGEQRAGQESLKSLCRAVDVDSLGDTDELLFKPFILTATGEFKRIPTEQLVVAA